MSWLDDIENAVEDAFKNAFEVISAAFQAGETVIGDVIDVAGAPLQFVIDGVAYEIGGLTGIRMRRLTPAECNTLKGVFGTSLPADKIYLTSLIDIDHRQFTLPGSMVADVAFMFPPLGRLLAMRGMFEHLQDKYLIQAGRRVGRPGGL